MNLNDIKSLVDNSPRKWIHYERLRAMRAAAERNMDDTISIWETQIWRDIFDRCNQAIKELESAAQASKK